MERTVINFNNRNCYESDTIYYDCETNLVAGTSAKQFPLLRMAKAVAKRAYEGKVRKTTGLPYEDHCTEIYRLCMHYQFSHGDDVMYAAAVLHDYLEDAVKRGEDQITTIEWMKKTFGYSVTTIVVELTNEAKNAEGKYPKSLPNGETQWIDKSEYTNYKLSEMSPKALFLKLLDILSNLGDAETLPDFVRRIRSQITFIDNNIETIFKVKMTTDHRLVLESIGRILSDIYREHSKTRYSLRYKNTD
ncbi:MAG: HD domain-containing protein [Oscillospiraceae bacterium]|nr:HD domain-containing protein [Oscillospiraceae bacterium]